MKTSKIIKRVAFFGDGMVDDKNETYKSAYECGKLLAQNGYTIVNGGGPGVMLASTLGAKEKGGRVELVAVCPKNEPDENYEGQSCQNVNMADKIYEEKNYHNRIEKLSDVADAFLVFKGGTGTIAELGYVWSWAKFNYGKHEPIIFVGRGWKEVINKIKQFLDLEDKEMDVVSFAFGAKDVLKILRTIGR